MRIKWEKYNWIIIKNQWSDYNAIYLLILERAKLFNDKVLLDNLTLQKLKWQIDNLHKKWILSRVEREKKREENIEKKKNLMNEILLDFEKENIKKQKQNLYLKKNFREELSISSVRNSIIESLDQKIKDKNHIGLDSSLYKLYLNNKKVEKTKIIEHIITDIHLNEAIIRKNNVNNWSTEIGLLDFEKTINHLISKQNWEYKQINLLLLWDLIWTTIHDWLELDIEPIRAASFLASALAQAYNELKKYYIDVKIIIVPWNHSETRKHWNKTDEFNENYDFIVWEKLKEFLILNWNEKDVLWTTRDLPIVAQKIGKYNHAYIHWDRYWTNLKNILSILEKYYNMYYIDYLHEWHFHTLKIRNEDDFVKSTYPCFCQPSSYGFNRIWVVSREDQVWNIYNENWEMIKTYSLNIDNKIEKKKFNLKFNLDYDLSEIFKETFNILKK